MASAFMDVYKKVGRGGAGNFYSKKDIEDVKGKGKADDVEAQSPTSTRALAAAIAASQPPPEYQHTGRGGAGNWIQPTELVTQGLSQAAAREENPTAESINSSLPTPHSPSATPKSPTARAQRPRLPPSSSSSSSTTTARYRGGRGGAGNYSVPDTAAMKAEREKKEKEEEEKAIKLVEERIRQDVEAGLAKPAKAYGGIGGAWELRDMPRVGEAGSSRG
ncbi:hypothetical protein BP5796_04882 [Coleophoma crateriformis]|uniref:Uncharacterized protein n=2 Tax=Coleophoma TaxID=453209 RepID=A0A3D8RB10_9HELO|nr:hypothetical protein BP6252_07671 [Coleophoma cylindrospora]RDW83391.1 hypothetical protein BP5796_04882 [Coleophoma crateriformis]